MNLIPEPENLEKFHIQKMKNRENIKHHKFYKICVYLTVRSRSLSDHSVPIGTVWVPGLNELYDWRGHAYFDYKNATMVQAEKTDTRYSNLWKNCKLHNLAFSKQRMPKVNYIVRH